MPGFDGRGRGQKRGGSGGIGAAGNCICVKCGYTATKKPGVPCMQQKCPNCGAVLLREGGKHYHNALKKRK